MKATIGPGASHVSVTTTKQASQRAGEGDGREDSLAADMMDDGEVTRRKR